ncbi:MAG: hypothetical protein FD145_1107 [Candidatus Saganbacteria bacterium]|uniref:Uncharacterized protein n=1 Tax=Candidatus Saganbacteria bacterium TaxID=2575572 RepID=A0A833L0S5_UNCSA|nr:MAG: hypothetical protein FD145_1107 [Candidatus Saganbacteria bacterium]
MKKLLSFWISFVILFSGSCFAMQPSVIGGVRDGLAIGFMADGPLSNNIGIRFGLEANSGKQPLVAFLGSKFYLANVGRSLMSFGLGVVAYAGGSKNAEIGGAFSMIFNRVANIVPLFFEIGVDVAGTSRAQAQLGFKIF